MGEKEIKRLALSPDTLLVSLMNQANNCTGLTSPTPPFSANRGNPFSQTSSPRVLVPSNNNGFHHLNSSNPSSPSPTSPWSNAPFSMNSPRPASYASVVNGGGGNSSNNNASLSSSSPLSLPFYGNSNSDNTRSGDFSEEFDVGNLQIQDQLSFLDDSSLDHNHLNHPQPLISPSGRSDSMIFPYEDPTNNSNPPHQMVHRRSCSMNDVFLGGGNGVEDCGGGGFGWRPCMYFARGFCKNGGSCKFLHGGGGFDSPEGSVVGSPSKIDGGGFDEFLMMKALQQQRLAAASQLMASGGQHPLTCSSKALNFLNDSRRSAAAALMMGEKFHKFGRHRPDRIASMGLDASANSSARQIYLTFPADSMFKEEDVSNYFSIYGPVQDVRIPYQQKRMFGFVTFVYPETVTLILAKGNPHFVGDSRVLVKPYKEKGKVVEKKHQQQLIERGEFFQCPSPTGFDSGEPYDLPFGAGMFYSSQEMMLRRKLEEQAELQQAIDLQRRRLMSMQLVGLKNHQNNNQFLHSLSPTSPILSPRQFNQNLILVRDNPAVQEGITTSLAATDSPKVGSYGKTTLEAKESSGDNVEGGNKVEKASLKDFDLHESFEHALPDNLFTSPTKLAADRHTLFSGALTETVDSNPNATSSFVNTTTLASSSAPSILAPKSSDFQMSRFSSGQESIDM